MEIHPGVHAVKLLGATAFLIVEDELTLIDAGLEGSGRLLRWHLGRIGREQGELTRIVCTHAHPDHIGGVRELVTGPHVEVLMHPADTARLKIGLREVLARPSPGQIVALITRGPEDARPIQDGEVLPVLGGLEVVHAPGHTPGSVCLYARRHRLLFVGDVLQVIRGRLSLPSRLFSDDRSLAARSIARLAELDVETICFAHYPTWRVRARDALRELADPAPARPPSPADGEDRDAGTGRASPHAPVLDRDETAPQGEDRTGPREPSRPRGSPGEAS